MELLACCLLSSLFVGCKRNPEDFKPLSSGYGYVAKWVGMDSGPSVALYYKVDQSKPVLIWPFFGPSSGEIQITNEMAFFMADMPDTLGRVGSGEYFAVQAAGPALIVSEDILKLWAESKHLDFTKVRSRYSPLEERAEGNGIWVHYAGYESEFEVKFVVSWEQVSNIIQDVKQNGRRHIIKGSNIIYLKKDYDSFTNSN